MNAISTKKAWLALVAAGVLLPFLFAGSSAAQSEEPPRIHLQAGVFDPLQESPPGILPGMPAIPGVPSKDQITTDLSLVQFTGPVLEAWKQAVEDNGARLYAYVPDFAFIARIQPASIESLRGLSFVRWIGPYQPAYRLSPSLLPDLQAVQSAQAEAEPIEVSVITTPDAALDSLRSLVQSLGGQILGESQDDISGQVRLEVPASGLAELVAQDGVIWIEPVLPVVLLNDRTVGIFHADSVRASLGLYGAGQIVAIADTGLDTGNLVTLHADLRGRVIRTYCLGRPYPCDWSDNDSHGTHVAGSVLGNGSNSGSNPALHRYSGSYAGIAPEAKLVMQSIGTDNPGSLIVPADIGDLMRQAYNDGARIHSDSWGGYTGNTAATKFGGYTTSSSQIDKVTWERKDMLVLFAAGNFGIDSDANGKIDPDSLVSPGTAKNALTVGASENNRLEFSYTYGQSWPLDFPVGPIRNDSMTNNINGLAAFSSRGPADDGRIKPDLVASGTFIISTLSQKPEVLDPDYHPGWGIVPGTNQKYLYNGGTSMSTPLTAGAAAIVREWLVRIRNIASPTAALVKALLVNGAANMAPGQYTSPQEIPNVRPNAESGWGRVDLAASLMPAAPQSVWTAENRAGLGTNGVMTYYLRVGSGGSAPEPLGAQIAPLALSSPSGSELPREQLEAGALILKNGGFENGQDLSPWSVLSVPAGTHNPVAVSGGAHSGIWSAFIGDTASQLGTQSDLYQVVGIPAEAAGLKIDFWYKTQSAENEYNQDFLCFGMLTTDGKTVYWSNCFADFAVEGSHGWAHFDYSLRGVELAAVQGKSVIFDFQVQSNNAHLSQAWIDDSALTTTNPIVGGPFRITLAWTDYPAAPPTGRALVNDLDLEVIAPNGQRYYGNSGAYLTGSPCLRSGKWDQCNNLEGVVIPRGQYGVYTVIVHGYNVPHGPQPYALAASADNLRKDVLLNRKVFVPLLKQRK